MTQKKGVTSSNLSAQKTENLSTHSILTNTPSKSSAKKNNPKRKFLNKVFFLIKKLEIKNSGGRPSKKNKEKA